MPTEHMHHSHHTTDSTHDEHEAAHSPDHTKRETLPLRRRITNGVLCVGAAASAFSAAKGYITNQEGPPSIWAGATLGASIAINGLVFASPVKTLLHRRRTHGSWRIASRERDIITHGIHDTTHALITSGGYLMHALGGATRVDQLLAFGLSALGMQMFWPSTKNLQRGHDHSHGHAEGSPLVSKRRARLLAGLNIAIGGAGLSFGADISGNTHSSAAIAEGVHNTGDGVYAFQASEKEEKEATHGCHGATHEHDEKKKSLLEKLRAPIVRQIGIAAIAVIALMGSQSFNAAEQSTMAKAPQAEQAPPGPEVSKQFTPPTKTKASTPKVTVKPGGGIYDLYKALDIPAKQRPAVLKASQKILMKKNFTYKSADGLRISKPGAVPAWVVNETLRVHQLT